MEHRLYIDFDYTEPEWFNVSECGYILTDELGEILEEFLGQYKPTVTISPEHPPLSSHGGSLDQNDLPHVLVTHITHLIETYKPIIVFYGRHTKEIVEQFVLRVPQHFRKYIDITELPDLGHTAIEKEILLEFLTQHSDAHMRSLNSLEFARHLMFTDQKMREESDKIFIAKQVHFIDGENLVDPSSRVYTPNI